MAVQAATLKLDGALPDVRDAVDTAITAMAMKVTSARDTEDGFRRSAAEKTNWLSTKWPFRVDVVARPEGDDVLLEILGEVGSSIGAKRHLEGKIDRFLDLVRTHGGATGGTSAT